jgi:hypothetical protein
MNFNNWNFQQPFQSSQNYGNYPSNQMPMNTNLAFVTSLDEALARSNTRGSDIVYFHQDKDVFYRVKVDMEGRKSWMEFAYSSPNPALTTPATKADIQELLARIEKLEGKGEVNTDGQSNG